MAANTVISTDTVFSTDTVISAASLTKRFGRSTALAGLDLTVERGEVHGFLGPNGAGKSTTLRILLGLMRASGGTVSVLSRDPWRDAEAVRRAVAYVPGDVSLWPGLTGGEIVDLLTSLRGGADAGLRRRLLDDFELDPRKKARAYSKGNRQKVGLVAALARPAELYIFDEPTSGLDPVMESVFREHLRRIRDDGSTVLLSSHILSEVEHVCDRVTIIRGGVTVESGSLAELRHVTRASFRVTGLPPESDVAGSPGVHAFTRDGESASFEVDHTGVADVLTALGRAGVTGILVAPPSLESLFLRHYSAPTAPDGTDGTDGRTRGTGAAAAGRASHRDGGTS
ncbi:ABC transporter ATP-binding protein [Planctomonas psychrotolerans]|uniref:ABC transporter ATP-binding protein n=1 Tax=Planctomonas psychrotolerans TaxID=2528712 RepID=UPI0012390B90|nr:ABC transporter ATP-binding protein [Planctomonas psychrotolerans]